MDGSASHYHRALVETYDERVRANLRTAFPPGGAGFMHLVPPEGDAHEVTVVCVDPKGDIAFVGDAPELEWRVSTRLIDHTLLIVFMVQIGPRLADNRFMLWLNLFHEHAYERRIVDCLARQDELAVQYLADTTRFDGRTVSAPNRFRALAQALLGTRASLDPWSMADFDRARARYCGQFPSLGALWRAIGDNADLIEDFRGR